MNLLVCVQTSQHDYQFVAIGPCAYSFMHYVENVKGKHSLQNEGL